MGEMAQQSYPESMLKRSFTSQSNSWSKPSKSSNCVAEGSSKDHSVSTAPGPRPCLGRQMLLPESHLPKVGIQFPWLILRRRQSMANVVYKNKSLHGGSFLLTTEYMHSERFNRV
jgi:hypothetical protein